MEQPPTFTQIIRQAIDARLLDVHTALIGRVEKYDASTQLADIQPVIKRAIKSIANGELRPNVVDERDSVLTLC